MGDVKLDPLTCQRLAAWAANRVPADRFQRNDEQDKLAAIAAQLTAAANLRPLDAEQVRAVVRETFATVARLSGYRFPQRVIEDVATRVASQLTGAVVGLSAEERKDAAGLRAFVRAASGLCAYPDPQDGARDLPIPTRWVALLDRLLLASAFDSAARTITGESAEQLTARLDADVAHPRPVAIGPEDTATIVEALEYMAARKPGAPIADIGRIHAQLTSGGGS